MGHYHAGCSVFQRSGEYFAWVRQGHIKQANCYGTPLYDFATAIQREADEIFLALIADEIEIA